MEADQVVLAASLVTLTSTVGFSLAPEKWGGKGELPPIRLLVGGGLTFMGLSILGQMAPQVAKPLAAAMAVTALTYYGIPVLEKAFTNQ